MIKRKWGVLLSVLGMVTLVNTNEIKVFAAEEGTTSAIVQEDKPVTVSQLEETANDKESNAVTRINQGQESLSDYALLKIKNVKDENLAIIRNCIKESKGVKGSDLNKNEISQVVVSTIAKINDSLEKFKSGNATNEDYKLFLIESVNGNNISDINTFVSGNREITITKVKELVAKYLEAISKINSGIEEENDYLTSGIYTFKSEHIQFVRNGISKTKQEKGSDLNKAEIEQVITNVEGKLDDIIKNVNLGSATLEEYKYILCEKVNENNIADINSLMRDKRWTEIINICGKVNLIADSLTNINADSSNIEDYKNLDIYSVDSSNLVSVKEGIKENKSNKNAELSRTEIFKSVDETIKIMEFFSYINLGNASKEDYEYIGATGVTENNIEYLNEVLKGKEYTILKRVQEAIDSVVIPLKNINSGIESVEDYGKLAIEGITESNLEDLRKDIRLKRDTKGEDLTRNEIKDSVDNTLKKLSFVKKVNLGQATIEEYEFISITGINETNIRFINERIIGSNLSTNEEIQSKVNQIMVIYNSIVKINSGEASIEDYRALGITVREDILVEINNVFKEKNIEDVEVIKVEVNKITEVHEIFTKITSGNVTIEEFNKLGITVVTEENYTYVIEKLKGKEYLTKDDVNAAVNTAVNTKVAFGRINLGKATVSDYSYVGVTGVNASNLVYVNINVRGGNYTEKVELQSSVNNILEVYESILKANRIIAKVNNGEATLDEYEYIGINGVTDKSLWFITLGLKGMNLNNTVDIQDEVDKLLKMFYAYDRINMGQGTLEDYILINISGVTEKNIICINENIKGKNYYSKIEMQTEVTEIVKVYEVLVKINVSGMELSDYTKLGITGVNETNITYINEQIKNTTYITITQLQSSITSVVKVYNAYTHITTAKITIEEYELLGITGVTSDNIIYINEILKGNTSFSKIEIQRIINENLNICNALVRINKGIGTVADYEVIGSKGVTVDNVIYVNANIKRYRYTNVNKVNEKVEDIIFQYETNLRVNEILGKINLGTATVEEYDFIGIVGVNQENLVYVTLELKDKNYTRQFDIQNAIDTNIKKYEVLQKINKGEATLEDYKYLEITQVTSENRSDVNLRIKGLNILTSEKVKEKVLEIIENLKKVTMTGVLKDATTAKPIVGAEVTFKSEGIDQEYKTTTDSNGAYSIVVTEGTYNVTVKKDGYIDDTITVECGKDNSYKELVSAPARTDDKYCAVLTWGETPTDLDSHLKGKTANNTSIDVSFSNKTCSEGGVEIVKLDVDDTTSYGPETTTFKADSTGTYNYYIKDFSNSSNSTSKALSASGAVIKLYKGSELVKTYTVPTGKQGTVWNVFNIENGQIKDINTVTA